MAPYYVRPSQDGIFAHYAHLSENGGLPIVLYNVPARTGADIAPETMGRLVAGYPEIVIGLKDATGTIARVGMQRDACGARFCQLSGHDETTLAFMASGGRGAISVTANIAPRLCAEIQEAWLVQDFAKAALLNENLLPLHRALFAEPSPAPLKYAMVRKRRGYPGRLRLPMVEIGSETEQKIDRAIFLATTDELIR
jgi:4-hydroxy-tetrahydrodipicolinate synthase